MSNKRFRVLTLILVVCALSSVLLVACKRPGTEGQASSGGSSSTASSGPSNQVKMSAADFEAHTVSITKGQKVVLVDDGPYTHIIANGKWDGGAAKTTKENGAPSVNNVNISSGQIEIGPFATAGTFNIYCTIHQNMNLAVTVK